MPPRPASITRTVVVANQKGGVGKTTTAVNLAAGLAGTGLRVLLIDMDPQGNSTFAVLGAVDPDPTVYQLLLADDLSLTDVVQTTAIEGLDILPSDINLAGAEVELLGAVGSNTRLRSKLQHASHYDYVVIDTPPSLGLLTINSLAAATGVIIPVSTSVFALKGIVQLERTINQVRSHLDHAKLQVSGVLCTMYDHTNVADDVVSLIRQRFPEAAFTTVIPKNVKVEEAHSRGQPVFAYAPESKGAEAYREFVHELLDRDRRQEVSTSG